MEKIVSVFLLVLSLTSCIPPLQKHSANALNERIGMPARSESSFAKAARSKIRKAYQIQHYQPRAAAVLFFSAAREINSLKPQPKWSKIAYQDALGMGIEIVQKHQLWGEKLSYRKLILNLPAGYINRQYPTAGSIDKIEYAGTYRRFGLAKGMTQIGRGVPMVAITDWQEATADKNQFIGQMGYFYAVTAEAKWLLDDGVAIVLTDSRMASNLANNYGVPLMYLNQATKEMRYSGLMHVLRPSRGISEMGLFSYEPWILSGSL